jgi:glycosyltransferase involved in cell wall biosynthesis
VTPVTVAINATALLSPLTGIGHYIRSLAQALVAGAEADLHYFYGTGWSATLRDSPVPRIVAGKAMVKKLVPRAYEVMRFVQQRRFNAGIRRLPGAVYHEPNFLAFECERPTVITAHDLSWLRYPHTQPPDRVRVLNARFGPALARCAHVITDAESVRREIIETYAVAPERITAVPLAAREIFRPRDETACAGTIGRHDLAWRHYFLCVGTLEPRKNLQLAVQAYAGLPAAVQSRFPLVIVGMKGWLTSELDRLLAPLAGSGHVRLIGYVDDDALAALYAAARAMVYPSLYEGFGLPPLEAMASGTPVIASSVSSLPEVVGEAGVLVDPADVEALRTAMRELAEDDRRWEALRSAGLARAAKFSWSRCARETLAVYRQVLA